MSIGSSILTSILNRVPVQGTTYNGIPVTIYSNPMPLEESPGNKAPDILWQTQPHLRTVVDFLARGIAKLGIHAFTREGDDRIRDRDSELIQLLHRPNEFMTQYELIYDLVANLSIYNRAYWFIKPGKHFTQEIHPFPASWVGVEYENFWKPLRYTITSPEGKTITVPAENVIAFEGWNPIPGSTVTPIDSLRMILEEQHHAKKHRLQVWRNNGRVGSYITRPADAPKWDKTQRRRFYEMYEAFVGDNGSKAGSAPLLEDGMGITQTRFNSADEQWAESVKLSLETVAQVYQVNPTMVGILDNANYSNVREFNRMLYTMTLGPTIKMIEQRINTFLLPLLGYDPNERFVEFNIKEQIRGSFEEQAAVANTAVGAPYITVNEFRADNNLRALEGGDELIRPLNMGTADDTPVEGEPGTPAEEEPAAPAEEEPAAPKSLNFSRISGVLAKHSMRASRVYAASKKFDVDRFTRELYFDLGDDAGYFVSGQLKAYNELLKRDLENGGENFECPITVDLMEGKIRFED